MVISQNNISPAIGNPPQSTFRSTNNTSEIGQSSQQTSKEDSEQRRLDALAQRENELEDVIARSEDGDTLQVKSKDADIEDEDIGEVNGAVSEENELHPEQEEILAPEIEQANAQETDEQEPANDVRQIPPEPVEPPEPPEGAEAQLEAEITKPDIETTAERLAEEDATRFDNANAPTTYAGISDMSLEQMYRDGIISRYDYDMEMQARKDARLQMATDQRKISEEMNAYDREERRAEQTAEAIRTATSDRTANQDFEVSAADRLDAIENLNKGNEVAKQNQRREEDNNREWQFQQSLA